MAKSGPLYASPSFFVMARSLRGPAADERRPRSNRRVEIAFERPNPCNADMRRLRPSHGHSTESASEGQPFRGALKFCELASCRSLALRHVRHRGLSAGVHFLGGQILLLRADSPEMTERILDLSIAVAPELILEGHDLLGTGGNGLLPCCVAVGDVHVKSDGRAAERRGRFRAHH